LFWDPHKTLCGQNVELLHVKLAVHIVTTVRYVPLELGVKLNISVAQIKVLYFRLFLGWDESLVAWCWSAWLACCTAQYRNYESKSRTEVLGEIGTSATWSTTTCPGTEADENGLVSRGRWVAEREQVLVMALLLEVNCHRLNFGQLTLVPHRAVPTTWYQLSAGAVKSSFIVRRMPHLFVEAFTPYSDYLRGGQSGDRI
jgi:hypothetical protein